VRTSSSDWCVHNPVEKLQPTYVLKARPRRKQK
jgi:hypothetical protein